ncbi:MAG: hypothetical protein ACXAEU_12990 [Candidatus Hodarchaeales archaeon]
MIDEDALFSSVILCYFMDSGPESVDFYSTMEFDGESSSLIATRLMTKSTMLVKGDIDQNLEGTITYHLSGPDIFPADSKFRMVWYNWVIENDFSDDPRVRKFGSMAGLYCVFSKRNEYSVRKSLKVIEEILKTFSSRLKTISDVIALLLEEKSPGSITKDHYTNFHLFSNKGNITKPLLELLNEKAISYSKLVSDQEKWFKDFKSTQDSLTKVIKGFDRAKALQAREISYVKIEELKCRQKNCTANITVFITRNMLEKIQQSHLGTKQFVTRCRGNKNVKPHLVTCYIDRYGDITLDDMVSPAPEINQTEIFKKIFQFMILKKGTQEEIVSREEKRLYWSEIIKQLDKLIIDDLPDITMRTINERQIREVYHLLAVERLWMKLPVNDILPSIQPRDVADYFLYYWLSHHQLLVKKAFISIYKKLIV